MKKITKYIVTGICGAALVAGCLVVAGCGGSSNSQSGDSSSTQSSEAAANYTLVEDGKLIIGTSPDYPPFENLEDGEYVGFDIALGKAVAEKLGLEASFTTIQFDGIIPAIVSGGQVDVGISGFSVDPEREKQVDFTDAYYTDDQSICAMKDSKIQSEEDLNKEGVVIAVQTGTTGEDYAKENYPKATVKGFGNSTDAFAAMQSGKADAVMTNKAVVESMLTSYTDAQVIKSIATGEEYAIAVSKDNPELTKAINEAIEEMQSNGEIETMEADYLG